MVEKVGARQSHDILQNLARVLMSIRKAENNENAHPPFPVPSSRENIYIYIKKR